MSVKIMAQVWDVGPTDAPDRLMLLAIADHADDHGVAWPGIARLAVKCCVTERTAQRTISRLVDNGWLVKREGGGRYPNRYQILFPEHPTPDAHVTGDPDVTPDAHVGGTPDAHVTPPPTPTSPEPSRNHHSEPSEEVGAQPQEQRSRIARPAPLPLTFEPRPAAELEMQTKYGGLIDIGMSTDRFRAHYIAHQERTSRNWTAEWVKWVVNDAERAKQRLDEQREATTDEFGMTDWQRHHDRKEDQ